MQRRTIGRTDLKVAPLMLGGNVFGWTIDEATSFAVLDAFVDAGFNFIDTADVYSRWKPGNDGGESETIVGRWLAASPAKRGQVVLATKVGMDMGGGKRGLRAEYLVRAAEASLARLRTDRIDLYQAHTDDATVPLEETLRAFDQLVSAGKVRVMGASNYTGARLREAEDVARAKSLSRYETLQPEYNLYDRETFERDLQPVAAELGLGVIPYFSLASGFLTGKYKTRADAAGKSRGSRVERYFDARGLRILAALGEVAAETGAKEATVALAWLLARKTILAPIASATSTQQLEDLVAAPELRLSAQQLTRLTEASA